MLRPFSRDRVVSCHPVTQRSVGRLSHLPAGDSEGSHQAEQLEAVNPAKRWLGVTVVLPFAKSLTL